MPTDYSSIRDNKLADQLKSGRVGVLPTDTLYGLVCLAEDRKAVDKLYKLKHRDKKPGTVVAANMEQLAELGIKLRYLKAVAQYWPGQVSVVVPCTELAYLHIGANSIAVRVVTDSDFKNLLLKTGPLLTTSANHPKEEPASNINEAKKYFGDSVDFYVEGGDLYARKPSTIIRMIDDAVEVIRNGAVKINEETGKIL